MPKLLDQERAKTALSEVRKALNDFRDKKDLLDYRQELQQTPSRILASGLGQTLAFYASKKGVHLAIAKQLTVFLSRGRQAEAIGFLDQIMATDTAQYRQITRQALAYAEWLKRYSKALIAD